MARKEELFSFPNLNVEFKTGPITSADVDVIVNSANGTMVHGSGTAADISKASGELMTEELKEYASIVEQMPGIAGAVYREVWKFAQKGKYHQPTKLQLECAKFFSTNMGVPLGEGEIVLTSSGDLVARGVKWIIHAIGMTYDYKAKERDEKGRPPIIPAKPEKIKEAVLRSLNLIRDKKLGTSVAIPIMSVRKGGVTPEESLQAIKEGIEEHLAEQSCLEKVIIIGDNPESARFLREIK